MKFTKSIQTSDLQLFGSLEDAQKHELSLLFVVDKNDQTEMEAATDKAATILSNKEKVIDILTTTERSHPSARKINGGTRKKRTPKTEPGKEPAI